MTSSWCRVVANAWASQTSPTSALQPPETARYLCISTNGDGGCEHTSLCGLLICSCRIAPFPGLSQPLCWLEQGSTSMCNITKRTPRQGSPEAEQYSEKASFHSYGPPLHHLLLTTLSILSICFSSCLLNDLQNSFTSKTKSVNTEVTPFGIIYSAKHYLRLYQLLF